MRRRLNPDLHILLNIIPPNEHLTRLLQRWVKIQGTGSELFYLCNIQPRLLNGRPYHAMKHMRLPPVALYLMFSRFASPRQSRAISSFCFVVTVSGLGPHLRKSAGLIEHIIIFNSNNCVADAYAIHKAVILKSRGLEVFLMTTGGKCDQVKPST